MLPMSPARDGLENLLKKSFPTTCREVMGAAGVQTEKNGGRVILATLPLILHFSFNKFYNELRKALAL